jgi:DNA-binding MarR family transcriptional regulator
MTASRGRDRGRASGSARRLSRSRRSRRRISCSYNLTIARAKPAKRKTAAGAEIGGDCLAVRVRLLNRTITRIYDATLKACGLTIAQLNLLATIGNLQPATAHDVAEMLSMEISTLSRNARLMGESGWIEVLPAERGNGRILRLTDDGAAKLEQALPAWHEAQAQTRELLGDDNAEYLTRLVDGLWRERLAPRKRARPDS